MKILILVLALLLTSVILISCKKDNPIPPGEQPQLNLTLEDVSCTEAWIKLTTANLPLPVNVELQKDGIYYHTINLISADTVLYIDSLFPNKTYSFKSINQSLNQSITSSDLQVVTMDTTSHNFKWQTWTFGGQAGTCALYDVAVIDENNIWTVGEIYLLDSLGQTDPYPYNLAVWDGINWDLKKINYEGIPPVIHSVFAIDKNNIWLDPWLQWNGQEFQQLSIPSVLMGVKVNKMWGNSDGIYVVGDNGFIARGDFIGNWIKIESGTEANIGDIWGVPDGSGGYNKYLAADNKLLRIDEDNNLKSVNAKPGNSIASVWGKSNRLLYTAGGYGLMLYKNYQWEKINRQDVNTIYCIRGDDFNDVFGLSSTFSILHFNGFSWQYIITPSNIVYYRLDVKDGIISAVGWQGEKAAVTFIKRNN